MIFRKTDKHEDAFFEQAIRGERTGLEYLVSAYKDLAYTVALRIVMNKEDAEEVVQDSFMRAFASLDKFKRASKFSTWLFRIVYNTALTKVKNKTMQLSDLGNPLEDNAFDIPDHTEYDLVKKGEREKFIGMALSRLSDEDHLVISLFYIGEKSISEIRDISGLKTSAIKMRLLRGRKQLEIELKVLLNTEIRDLL
jgi:RNA polymerase sigma-70 factor (ECF subfamily)